jgi:DNA polymerase III subunit delta'
MTSDQLVVSKTARQQVWQVANGDRQPHALLLWGTAGAGTLPLALWYVRRSMCKTATDKGEPCGVCSTCHKVGKYMHADVHYSFPVTGAGKKSDEHYGDWREMLGQSEYLQISAWMERMATKNQQGNINKDECQRIGKIASMKAYEGGRKVILIWLPEYLAKEGNRLLKLIEEPPPDTLFVLVAENTALILPTILSRCQAIHVSPLTDGELADALMHVHHLGADEAASLAMLAEGSYIEALSLLSEKSDDRSRMFIEWLRLCYAGKGLDLVARVDELAELGRERQKYLMRYGLQFIRELMLLVVAGGAGSRLRGEELESAKRLASLLTLEQLDLLRLLLEECAAHLERNANAKTLLLSSSLYMHSILRTGARAGA